MIDIVTLDDVTYGAPPHRFEAGTPPILEAIGLGAAIAWLGKLDRVAIAAHEHALYERVKVGINGANWLTETRLGARGRGPFSHSIWRALTLTMSPRCWIATGSPSAPAPIAPSP